jgi:hypothetical protein
VPNEMIDVSTPVVLWPKKGRTLRLLSVALFLLVPVGCGMIWRLGISAWSAWAILSLGMIMTVHYAARLLFAQCYYLRISSTGFELHGLFWTRRYQWSDASQFYAGYLGRMYVVRIKYSPSFEPRSIGRLFSGALGAEHEGAIVEHYLLSQEALAAYLNQWKALAERSTGRPSAPAGARHPTCPTPT